MNKVLAAILSVLTVGSVAQAETLSPAYISQISYSSYANSFPIVNTAEIARPMFEVATAVSSLRPSNGNLGLVWQDGENNSASISQSGVGNVGLIRQIGLNNVASIDQIGSSHSALVSQQGNGNFAMIRQR